MITFRKLTFLLTIPLLCASSHSLDAKLTWKDMPNAFRCVLDKNTRVLVVKLNDTTAIAYDTGKCQMIKIWQNKDGRLIDLTGPVFNGQHGKQPLSIGETLVTEKAALFSYRSAVRDSSLPRLQYRGHKLNEEKTTLIYAYLDDQGHELAVIEETPMIKNNIVSRSFKITLSDHDEWGAIQFNQPAEQKWMLNGKILSTFNIKKSTTISLSISLTK